MILIAAAILWLLTLAFVTRTPRLGREARRNAQFDVLALGALGILTAGFFWRLLFTPNTFMPAGGGDLAGFLYPTFAFAQTWITRGVLPLWNPNIFGGTPFVGDIQTALFYPLNLLTYFLANPLQYRDLEYLSVLHFYIAGAGMYVCLRFAPLKQDAERITNDLSSHPTARGVDRSPALAGALAFAFSDLFIIHFGNLNLIATAAWLPLIFLFFAKAIDAAEINRAQTFRAPLTFSILAAGLLALAFFAGHIQPFLFILLALALYAAYHIALERARWKHIALVFIITFGVGIGLSAITLLPALELTQLSVRSAFGYTDAAQFSLPPLELIGMLVPGFFGRGAQDAWGPWARVEVGYIGIFPLLLAGIAVVLRRNARTMFFVLLAIVGLLLALGGYAILHGWLFQFVPGFGQLRAPARFVLVMDFALAVLAALGMDALLVPMSDAARRAYAKIVRGGAWVALLVALVSGALAVGILILGQAQDPALFQRIANAANGIAFFILLLGFSFALLLTQTRAWLPPRVWAGLALALIFFDLFSLGAYVDVGNSDPTLGYQRADVLNFLKNNTGLERIDSRTDVEGLWRPDTGLLYGLQDVYGDNPLVLNSFNTFWEQLGGRDRIGYSLLNVKYALTRRGTPMPSNFSPAFDGGGGISVWENRCTVSRAWIVYNAVVVQDPETVLNLLGSQGCFDPSMRVPITAAPALTGEGAREISHPDFLGTDAVEITGYAPNEIVANANARFDGYLVLSEIFAPGWRAFVDGQEVPVVRANYLFRAIPLSVGLHQVRMVYDPLSYKVGASVSAVTLVLVLAAFVYSTRRPR